MSAPENSRRPIVIWLVAVYLLILGMVVVGGVTRLTGSGLSMTEWRPLMGALPPLNEAEWTEVFDQYQQSPQYEQVNHWMTLSDFKRIFFWEYVHRALGRLIGVAFFLPWLWFAIRRRARPRKSRTLEKFNMPLIASASSLLWLCSPIATRNAAHTARSSTFSRSGSASNPDTTAIAGLCCTFRA